MRLLDLRAATTYQDSSLFDKQAPVSDLSYADSTTGRPWAECGQYTSGHTWGVDLGSEVYVRYVRLQNRNDCCAERLTDVDIYLGSTAETYTGNALVKSDVSVLSNVMLEVEINALGRYLYLQRENELTVCKIYVFASKPPINQGVLYLGQHGDSQPSEVIQIGFKDNALRYVLSNDFDTDEDGKFVEWTLTRPHSING